MADNYCATMQGSITGVSARLKAVAGNLIDLPDCSCHNIHLLSNDEIKNDSQGILKTLLKFVELFSDFLASTPKARLVFKHCSKVRIEQLLHFQSHEVLGCFLSSGNTS